MIGLLDREEKLLRLALDPGATPGESRAPGGRFVALLRERGYDMDAATRRVAALEDVIAAQDQKMRDLRRARLCRRSRQYRTDSPSGWPRGTRSAG